MCACVCVRACVRASEACRRVDISQVKWAHWDQFVISITRPAVWHDRYTLTLARTHSCTHTRILFQALIISWITVKLDDKQKAVWVVGFRWRSLGATIYAMTETCKMSCKILST